MRPDVSATASLLAAGGTRVTGISEEPLGVVCRLETGEVENALTTLKSEGYDFLVDLLAHDTGEALEVTWHIRSLADLREMYLKAPVPYDGEAPSVWQLYPAALFAEREAAELLGMSFPGHPNLKRLLTSDDVDGFLLRKSLLIRTEEEVTLLGDR